MSQYSVDIGYLDLTYLRPPSEALNSFIYSEKDKKKIRNVFELVQYTDFENQALNQLKLELQKLQVQIPENWKESDFLKCLYCYDFNILKSAIYAQKWINWTIEISIKKFPNTIFEIFVNIFNIFQINKQTGAIYQFGRDKQFRPIIVFNIPKLVDFKVELINQAFAYLLLSVQKQMLQPYLIEKMVFILDVGEMGIFKIPINSLIQIIEQSNNYFCMMCYRQYLVNPSFSLNQSFGVVQKLLTTEQNQRLKLLGKNQISKLLDDIDKNQLEKKYGGNITLQQSEYWPPLDSYKQQEQVNKEVEKQTVQSFITCQNDQDLQLDVNFNNQNTLEIDEEMSLQVPEEQKSQIVMVSNPKESFQLFKSNYKKFINIKNQKLQEFQQIKESKLNQLSEMKQQQMLKIQKKFQNFQQKNE